MVLRWTPGVRFGAMFVFALVVVTVGGWFLTGAGSQPEPATPRYPAPEIEPAIGWINADAPLRFSDELAGVVTLVHFWTDSSGGGHESLEELDTLEAKFIGAGFQAVSVYVVGEATGEIEALRRAQERATDLQLVRPIAVDSGLISQRWGVSTFPTFIVIDAEGIVLGAVEGPGHRLRLEAAIEWALGEAKSGR